MRITDLLDKRSISLDGAPKNKQEALDMAIDMGGPFNKAAYVFGTAAIAAGNYDIMAAVMIGGMIPPCAIALATLLFKDKFTKEERNAGPTNFIMGLAFITEGAIPFAAADPIHVLPACICWHW